MSDLFHEQVADDCIVQVFQAMADVPQHISGADEARACRRARDQRRSVYWSLTSS
jgi:protein gp37